MRKVFRGRFGLQPAVFVFLASAAVLLFTAWPGSVGNDVGKEGGGRTGTAYKQILPMDTDVRKGVLENGLTYYIRKNGTPANRAELRLVVNAGSVLEDDDQRGLAHFLEHMAFNGTEHFAKHEIVDYLESIGMRFGPELNAYTTYDETVYMLQVPTDREGAMDTGVHILDEWARFMSLEPEEIERERGVIVEEWRLRQGPETRIREKQQAVLFHGSRYAERNPIGSLEVIKTFQPETLRRFYRDWYRPDLIAVVAVGDFEPEYVRQLIEKHFSTMKPPENPPERLLYPVPGHAETLYSIVTDPEVTLSTVGVVTEHDPLPEKTVEDYRDRIRDSLFHLMVNARLEERARRADSPILNGYSTRYRAVRTKDFYLLGSQVKENGIDEGFRVLLTEAERVKRYGFTETELERQKKELMSSIEQVYRNRDKLESDRFVTEYVNNYLEEEPIPGIEYEYHLYRDLIPGITVEEMNGLSGVWLTEENRVILTSAPEKKGVSVPTMGDLKQIQNVVATGVIAVYQDRVKDIPLVATLPSPGSIREEKPVEQLGLTVLLLSNGVKVVLKPTDFKNDQILFSAYSQGGSSRASDAEYVAARTAADVVIESGVGDFDRIELQKKLAGKNVEVTPWIDELYEGMSGKSNPADLEAMFQLIYLYFTAPRQDEDAFSALRERLRSRLEAEESSPDGAFWYTVQDVMSGGNRRGQPLRSEMLDQMSLEGSYDFYRRSFSDAGNFTFFFVGSFDPERVRTLARTYLASLPASGIKESWRDLGIRAPEGVVRRTLYRGVEQKSTVAFVFHGPFDWRLPDVFLLSALGDAMEIPLRESLREEKSGTYNVSVFSVPRHYPEEGYRLYVTFGTAPEQVDGLAGLAFEIIRRVQEEGPAETDVKKVQEILRRERETNLRNNEFWLNILRSYDMNGMDFLGILRYDGMIDGLTVERLREAADRYFDFDLYAEVVLFPENWNRSSSKSEAAASPALP